MSFLSDTYSKWKSVSWIWDLIALLLIGGGIALIVEAPALTSQPLMIYLLSGLGIAITFFSHLAHILLAEPAEEYASINPVGGEYKHYGDQRAREESPPPTISMFSSVSWEPGDELYKAAKAQLRNELPSENKEQQVVDVKVDEKSASHQNLITTVQVLSARYLGVGQMFTNRYADARNTLTSRMNIPYLTLGSLSSESKHPTEEIKDEPSDAERYSNCEYTVSLADNLFPEEEKDAYIRLATKYDPVINFMLGQHYEKVDPSKAVSCYRTAVNGFSAINNFCHLDPVKISGSQSLPQSDTKMIRLGFEITNVLTALSYIEASMKVSRLYFRVAREANDLREPAIAKAGQYLENATFLYNQAILVLNTKLGKICSDYANDNGVIAARYLTAEVNNFFYRVSGQRLAVGGDNDSDGLIGLKKIPQFNVILQSNQLTPNYNGAASLSASANSSSSTLSFQ